MIPRSRRYADQVTSLGHQPLGFALPMRAALAALAVACMAMLGLFSGVAQACSRTPETNHCYALVESQHEYEGTWVDILTSSDSLSGWNEGDRLQNETWASFSGGGWVEVGDTTGSIWSYHTPTPFYFYAGEYPAGGQNFYEGDFSTGPSIGQWFWVQEQDEGNGVWCVWINGGETQCVGGRPFYTSEVEAGLEAAVNDPVVNNGTLYAWAMNLGGAWSSWARPYYYASVRNGARYCVFPVSWDPNSGLGDPGGSNLYPTGIAFGTPNNNPNCRKENGYMSVPLGGEATLGSASTLPGPPSAVDGTTATTATAEPVAEGYTPASGPTLSNGQLQKITQEAAQTAGDAEAASGTVQAVQTPLKTAMSAIEPTTTLPSTPTPGYANLLQSSTDLVVLHGQFALTNAPRPHNVAVPTGSVLELVIDAHTGWIDGVRVGNRAATNLSDLGAVTTLSNGG